MRSRFVKSSPRLSTRGISSGRDVPSTTIAHAIDVRVNVNPPSALEVTMATQDWDREADLVVIGFGAAGGGTSVAAADAGADVLLLEKQPAEWHTPSTRASGGLIMTVGDVEAATGYMDRCAGGLVPLEVTRAWAQSASDVVDFVENVVEMEVIRFSGPEHEGWEGAEAVSAYGARESNPEGVDERARMIADPDYRPTPRPGGGACLMAALERSVQARSRITAAYQHAGHRLLRESSRRVIGVQANTPDGVRRYRARQGVVLTCGG